MSTATTWPGFTTETDPDRVREMGEQLSRDFAPGSIEREDGERLSDDQVAEYQGLATGLAQRHERRADAHGRLSAAHREQAERLAEDARPVELVLDLTGAHPTFTEQKAAIVPPEDERVDLAEAATRLGLTEVEAVVWLGLDGHLADADGTFLAADVDAVKDAR